MIKYLLTILIITLNSTLFAQLIRVEKYYGDDSTHIKEVFHVLEKSPTVLDGLFQSYYYNGNKKSVGDYEKNKATGNWKFYFESGKIKMIGPLINNQSNGYWKYFFENGNIRMEGRLDDNKKNNIWKYYHENGLIKSKGSYKESVKDETWMYFHEDGEFKAQADYKGGRGDYFEFYSDGQIKMEGPIEEEKSNGHWVYRYPDGVIESEGEERNGLKKGIWVFNYTNGKKKSEGNFNEGKASGDWKYYHQNGNIKATGKKNEDKKYGYWKVMFETGKLQSETDYDQSESGEYTEFYESGHLKVKGAYTAGKHDGIWKYYYEDGTLEGSCTYNQGVGFYKGFFHEGGVKLEGNLKDGEKIGKWTMYSEKGKVTGYYKTYDKEEHPVFSVVTEHSSELPSGHIHTRKKKSSFFKDLATSEVGQAFKSIKPGLDAFIIEIHPFTPILGKFSGSYEYWVGSKYGHQLTAIYTKTPLLSDNNNSVTGKVFTDGLSFNYRFKYYRKSLVSGYVHFDQEIRYTNYNHQANGIDSTGNIVNLIKQENLIEYSLLFGNRYLLSKHKSKSKKSYSGWTIDTYIGVGVGYRDIKNNWKDSIEHDEIFSNISNHSISIPLRMGVTIGYVF